MAVRVLAGARSYVAIAKWAHDLPVTARPRLRIGRRSPSESTIRRLLQAVDLDALDVGLSAWLAARLPPPQQPSGMHVVAVNGKTARGAGIDEGTRVHLLAACGHEPTRSNGRPASDRIIARSPAWRSARPVRIYTYGRVTACWVVS